MPRDLSKEVWEVPEDAPVDPQEVVAVGYDDDRCPRCHAPDSIVFEFHSVAGARPELTTTGTCERCGHEVGAPRKDPGLREMPEQVLRDDFGRRRRGW